MIPKVTSAREASALVTKIAYRLARLKAKQIQIVVARLKKKRAKGKPGIVALEYMVKGSNATPDSATNGPIRPMLLICLKTQTFLVRKRYARPSNANPPNGRMDCGTRRFDPYVTPSTACAKKNPRRAMPPTT